MQLKQVDLLSRVESANLILLSKTLLLNYKQAIMAGTVITAARCQFSEHAVSGLEHSD